MLIAERARAKVNLTLQVRGRRPDGYHEIASLVGFASAADVVSLRAGAPCGVTVTGPFSGALGSETLITRTLAKLTAAEPRLRLGHVTLDKRLPIAAGIGGGSADAAAVLRVVARINPELAGGVDWQAIATSLGADVPVCLGDRLTFMTGVGERLTPLPPLSRPVPAVLVNPMVRVPDDKTAQVFRALAASPLAPDAADVPVPPVGGLDETVALIGRLGNALETAARQVVPAVGEVLAALWATPGCRVAQMSGAGPTCFGVFQLPDVAAQSLRQAHPGWWVEAVEIA